MQTHEPPQTHWRAVPPAQAPPPGTSGHAPLVRDALFGGVIGALIVGMTRAVFSNEAGVGSAAIAHSAAKTDEPVREGMVAMLGPFIDTIVICLMTASVI